MKRKLWAVKEIACSVKQAMGLFWHVALVWNVTHDERIADMRERSDDLDARIYNTPLKYDYFKLNRRIHRAMLALVDPAMDKSLLELELAFMATGTAGEALRPTYDRLEREILGLPEIL